MTLTYDGSFEGLLCCIFECYEFKWKIEDIVTMQQLQPLLIGEHKEVQTDETKAARVWMGLKNKLSQQGAKQFQHAFLSEQRTIPITLLQYACYVFDSKQSVEKNFSHPAVQQVCEWAKKVYREKHRMEAFVRFQLSADHIFYSMIEPDFNVLPIIQRHFKNRYADQKWIIYDVRRKYALYYDLKEVSVVTINFSEENAENILHEEEALYQKLWRQYFSSVNIAARKNTKLHVQHMPKRYWRYLIEKQWSN
jgi:probable DNA metabolism protein